MPNPMDSGSFASPHEWHQAFRTLRPLAEALPAEMVRTPTFSPTTAVHHILAAVERAQPFRESFQLLQPLFDMIHFDQLGLRAMALLYADVRDNAEARTPRQTPGRVDEARPIRERLLRAAHYLAAEGLMDRDPLDTMRGNRTHAELGADLLQLVLMFNQAGPTIQASTTLTRADLDEAAEVGGALTKAIAADYSEQGDEPVSLDLRNRYFTLAQQSYHQLQRGLQFIRFDEGDALTLAPNLAGVARRSPKSKPKLPRPPTGTL